MANGLGRDATLDDLVPMLKSLVRSARVQPSQDDLNVLVQTTVKETRMFFDALSSGRDERETYYDVLQHCYVRYSASKTVPDAVLKAAAKAGPARPRPKAAAAGSTTPPPAGAAAATPTTVVVTTTTVTTERTPAQKAQDAKDAEETERKRREGQLSREEEIAKQLKTGATTPAEAGSKQPATAAAAMVCAHCGKPIEDHRYLQNDDLVLHEACLEAWQEAHCPKCAECGKIVDDEYVELTPAGTTTVVTLHPQCVDAFKRKTRPKCHKCEQTIMDDKRMEHDGASYHVECAKLLQVAA